MFITDLFRSISTVLSGAQNSAQAAHRARDEPSVKEAQPVRKTRSDIIMLRSEAIYAAVSRISNTIASMPIHLYKGQEIQRGHELERLIAYAPNGHMTPFVFRQTMEACRNNTGNAYALIVEDGNGRPCRFDVLDSNRVTPMVEKESRETWYKLSLDDGRQPMIHASRMLALHHMCANGLAGVNPVDVLRGSIIYDADIKEFSCQQLQGVNNGVILNVPGTGLSKERRAEIVHQFMEAYEESSGHVMVLEGGLTATTLSQSPVDAKVLDVERITRNRVATVYNIPPHMLGDYTDTSYQTAEQSMLEYLQMTITAIVTQWEDELNRKLLTWDMIKEGYAFRFNLSALWRADMKTMGEVRQMGVRSGWIMPNEVRVEDGRPERPEGNHLLVSRDLVPLDAAIQAGANLPQAPKPAGKEDQ